MVDAVDQVIIDDVKAQLHDATTPETGIVFNVSPDVAKRADSGAVNAAVEGFKLTNGAADVTSYHDFSRLHIAFEHIWTELFDSTILNKGELLYQQYVQDPELFTDAPDAQGRTIQSVSDLREFLDEIANADSAGRQSVSGNVGMSTSGGLTLSSTVPTNALEQLLKELDDALSQPYAFDVFVPDAINFGVLVNYRQKWVPLHYQVGDLVSTIPLAPQEIQRYTTRTVVVKRTRNVKAIDDSLSTRKQESSQTSRADAEIVQKALTKTNFQLSASESFGNDEMFKMNANQSVDQNQAKESAETKRDFRESVLRAAQEYRDEHRLEVATDDVSETEATTFREIRNPNDELPVTYLFYELQRTFQVSEELHKVTPVVLVANEVPAPNEIDNAWLMAHDWIIRRSILDDSFLSALDYLATSFVGAEVTLEVLRTNMEQQATIANAIGQQVKNQNDVLNQIQDRLNTAEQNLSTDQGNYSLVKGFFDPMGLSGGSGDQTAADRTMVDAAKDALDRGQNRVRELTTQLETELTSLQTATNKFASAVEDHYNHLASLERLQVHVKQNILYYMQAIWTHEPPDQRYFRLYSLDVPIFDHHTMVSLRTVGTRSFDTQEALKASLPVPGIDYTLMKLNEVADIDDLLGFKGNYMIFPLRQYTYLTYYMMQDYVDVDEIRRLAKDPDEFGQFTLDDLETYMQQLHDTDLEQFNAKKEDFRQTIIDYLTTKVAENDMVIVPTSSLYIEALPGVHPLLEDFKLIHRAVDVKRAQADLRHAELENLRIASRVLKGNDEDPDIDKKIIVEGASGVVVGGP